MKLTSVLKTWAVANLGVKAEADDATFKKAIGDALIDGSKLTAAQYAQLSTEERPDAKALIGTLVDERVAAHVAPLSASVAEMNKALVALLQQRSAPAPTSTGPLPAAPAPAPATSGGAPATADDLLGSYVKAVKEAGGDPAHNVPAGIRVKTVKDYYRHNEEPVICPQYVGKQMFNGQQQKHPLAGLPAQISGHILHQPTELTEACGRTFIKFALQRQLKEWPDHPRGLRWNDHDQMLLDYMLHEMKWVGEVRMRSQQGDANGEPVAYEFLNAGQRKDLLDDAASGGTYAVPRFFDEMMVLTPLLFGELFPFVETVTVTRGRSIQGSSMSNPTFTSGVAEGTSITPFSTAGFIAQMDSTVFPMVSAVNIGLDFEDDTPIDISGNLIKKFGESHMVWLDRVIAVGDGTTEPQGFFNASGTTAVSTDNGAGGPPTVGDYEALFFGMNKAFRNAVGGRTAYVANDTTYGRARGIAVGPNDERRVFGMTHQDYMLLNLPYKVQNDIANSQLAFVNLGGYRLYRRLGMTVRIETLGSTLALKNERLIVVRGRYAGRLTLGGYAAIATDAQA